MKKTIIFLFLMALCVTFLFVLDCSVEKAQLKDSIIRLHVIANSDSPEDQAQKLRVRDVIIGYLSPLMDKVDTLDDAKDCITQNIPQMEKVVLDLLSKEGTDMAVRISLGDTSFDTRFYDTFALPAGVYSSLRIELGNAEGQNWWCVAFPSLCIPAAGKDFRDVAAGAGFSDSLTDSLATGNRYEVRFFVLDLLGKLENFFCKR